ncbi:MAG: PEP-CTERM sorting domain-containing protein [Akkermansia sp.]
MKKTLVLFAVMASAATAAEPVVYDSLLSSTEGWTLGTVRNGRQNFTIDTAAQSLTLTNSNWGQAYANYSLPTTLTATESLGIGFTFDVKINDIASTLTFSLIGTTQAITLGTNYDQDDLFVGTTSVTTSNAYSFKDWDGVTAGTSTTVASSASIADVATAGSTITISGCTKYDAGTGHHVLTLMCGDKSTTLDLGESVDVTRISFGGDGGNSRTNFVVSNLSLYTVPEPATATLSLLALAGLATRRRRKQA